MALNEMHMSYILVAFYADAFKKTKIYIFLFITTFIVWINILFKEYIF